MSFRRGGQLGAAGAMECAVETSSSGSSCPPARRLRHSALLCYPRHRRTGTNEDLYLASRPIQRSRNGRGERYLTLCGQLNNSLTFRIRSTIHGTHRLVGSTFPSSGSFNLSFRWNLAASSKPLKELSMPDDPNKKGPADRTRVNIHEPWEVEYWTKLWGVTAQQLKDCVQRVGPMVTDVKRCLGK